MSSSPEDQARLLAERIARRISQDKNDAHPSTPTTDGGEVSEELASMRASLRELQQKLAHIESHLTREERASGDEARSATRPSRHEDRHEQESAHPRSAQTPTIRSPWLSGMYVPATHPSQERFGVEEAAVSELVDYFERDKTCNLEPGGKPCDHCAMCSSRGF
jgi:hypothetical protein